MGLTTPWGHKYSSLLILEPPIHIFLYTPLFNNCTALYPVAGNKKREQLRERGWVGGKTNAGLNKISSPKDQSWTWQFNSKRILPFPKASLCLLSLKAQGLSFSVATGAALSQICFCLPITERKFCQSNHNSMRLDQHYCHLDVLHNSFPTEPNRA